MRSLACAAVVLLFAVGCGPEATVRLVVVDDAMGLHHGDPVRCAGVDVGRVSSVELRSGQAEIRFTVRPDVDLVTEETCGIVEARGLVGDAMLVLRPADVDVLPDEGTVTACGSEPALGDATGPMVSAATSLAEFMDAAAHGDGTLARLANDEELADALVDFLQRQSLEREGAPCPDATPPAVEP